MEKGVSLVYRSTIGWRRRASCSASQKYARLINPTPPEKKGWSFYESANSPNSILVQPSKTSPLLSHFAAVCSCVGFLAHPCKDPA